MPISGRNAFGNIVKVAAAVRPSGVMEEDKRESSTVFCMFFDDFEFVQDSIIVMVAINEDGVIVVDQREGFEAWKLLKRESRGVHFLPLTEVYGWVGVDAGGFCMGS